MFLKFFCRIFNLYSDLVLLCKYWVYYGNDLCVYFFVYVCDSFVNGIEFFYVLFNCLILF